MDGAVSTTGWRSGTATTPDALLCAAVACNDAELGTREGRPTVIGDPTEGALLVVAAKGGVTRDRVEAERPRLATVPFDADRKRMAVLRGDGDGRLACVKGAPEVILERCARMRTVAGVVPFDASARAPLEAGSCSRATACASGARRAPTRRRRRPRRRRARSHAARPACRIPWPKPARRSSAAGCRRVDCMITGDHPDTARAIARELGILGHGDEVLIGSDLDRLTDADLAQRVERVMVYARVTAEHKLRIVRAWKSAGAVVAMTGDGVNDAPALKEASIGIAMGITGTEVTKQAADMVVTDDNFASIVAAVEEGRGIYDNIAKTLAYLLAGNAGELAVMLIAALIG
jgi:Ca2+-transporting ATPase